MKPKQKTRKDLERKIMELEAQLASTYHFANQTIHKASTDHLMGSACLVTLTALGGREITIPFAVRDGLSTETIECLKKDLKRSYDLATLFKV